MKLIFVLLVFLLPYSCCYAQSGAQNACTDEFFIKEITSVDSTFDIYAMTALPDGDLILLGKSTSPGGSGSLVRMSKDGAVVWSKTYFIDAGAVFGL